MITQQTVKDLFDYDPETGECRWRVKRTKGNPGELIGDDYIYQTGYKAISLQGRTYLLHRLVWLWMEGCMPPKTVKHLNGDKTDNRWSNLSLVGNRKGSRQPVAQPSPYSIDKVDEGWSLSMPIAGVDTMIGTFDSEDKAHQAYQQARVVFGQ